MLRAGLEGVGQDLSLGVGKLCTLTSSVLCTLLCRHRSHGELSFTPYLEIGMHTTVARGRSCRFGCLGSGFLYVSVHPWPGKNPGKPYRGAVATEQTLRRERERQGLNKVKPSNRIHGGNRYLEVVRKVGAHSGDRSNTKQECNTHSSTCHHLRPSLGSVHI